MRREGFELSVGKPQVVTRELDGKLQEPVERLSIDAPEEYVGDHAAGAAQGPPGAARQPQDRLRMEYPCPARGLIGFRTEFLTETCGTGILHHVFHGYEPWHGELRTRPTGSLVADRRGVASSLALLNLQERGQLFVRPGVEVYEGMIVGENARAGDLDVNATKERKLMNTRSSSADELVRLIRRARCRSSRRSSSSPTTSASRSRRRTSGLEARALRAEAADRGPRKARGFAPVYPLPLRAAAPAPGVHELRASAGRLVLLAVPEPAGDVARVGLLIGEDEGDRVAAASRAAGAARAVHVARVLGRRS